MAGSVLIVDDDAVVRRALRRLFTSQPDFDVCGVAKNGREAIEKAQELYPDLIIMDISMPGMNGIEATRVLKRLMPSVPIIVFSEYCNVFSEQEAQSIGISALVSKLGHIAVLLGEARLLLCKHIAA